MISIQLLHSLQLRGFMLWHKFTLSLHSLTLSELTP